MVGLYDTKDKDILCGGSILSVRHVITAAHCTQDENPDEILVNVIFSGSCNLLKNDWANFSQGKFFSFA